MSPRRRRREDVSDCGVVTGRRALHARSSARASVQDHSAWESLQRSAATTEHVARLQHTCTSGPALATLSASPARTRASDTAVPAAGPASAMRSSCSRRLSVPRMGVMAPKLPMMPRPAGIRNGGSSLPPCCLAAMKWPASCAPAACTQICGTRRPMWSSNSRTRACDACTARAAVKLLRHYLGTRRSKPAVWVCRSEAARNAHLE